MTAQPLIRAERVSMQFVIGASILNARKRVLTAVDQVSLDIHRGETFGLVGESGCGKTTLGRLLLRLYKPTSGTIHYDGHDITTLTPQQMMPFRRRMQMIFQDPYASLDPRMTVSTIIAEPLRRTEMDRAQVDARVRELLSLVGLDENHARRYPHEFSGGQRQRIGIARALAAGPEFIVCDEPISALDVSIQAQVVNMLEELQQRLGLTYLFVSHDLSMVRHISHRVGVMYLGHMVEMAPVNELFTNMAHPYTQALMSAVPIADPDASAASRRIILEGDVPNPMNPPSGCPFRTRCPVVMPVCAEVKPELKDMGGGHWVACHRVEA